jgi:hypothetical protein
MKDALLKSYYNYSTSQEAGDGSSMNLAYVHDLVVFFAGITVIPCRENAEMHQVNTPYGYNERKLGLWGAG